MCFTNPHIPFSLFLCTDTFSVVINKSHSSIIATSFVTTTTPSPSATSQTIPFSETTPLANQKLSLSLLPRTVSLVDSKIPYPTSSSSFTLLPTKSSVNLTGSDDQSTKETPVTTSITVTEKSQTNSSVVHVNSTSGPEITASLSAKHLNTTESTIQLNAAKATTKSKRSESTFEDDVKVPREMSDSSQVNEENESNPFMSDAEDQNDNGFGDDDSGINGQGEPLQSESFEDTRRRPEDALDSLDEQGKTSFH